MTYDYDIFISYHRAAPVKDWVHNHFHHLLEEWLLESAVGPAPRIFIDTSVPTGSQWDKVLKQALLGSRLLVPVFSPSYFRSKWCVWELESMRAREQALDLRTDENARGLIFPVRFHDGVREDLTGIQFRDLQRFNVPSAAFAETVEYTEFHRAIQSFAEELIEAAKRAPPWQEGWPIEKPPVDESMRVKFPRL